MGSVTNAEEWSDSDDEVEAEVETSVLLGVPDGHVDAAADISDAAVSRIGGHPAFLPSSEPSITTSQCKICSYPMELLVQMWCPFEDSPMDRALYIWGCSRGSCQKKDGSVRAWRGLRYNETYAAKLEKKLARRRAHEAAKAKAIAAEQEKAAAKKSNPFSMQNNAAPNPFGIGSQIFGGAAAPSAPLPQDSLQDDGSDDDQTDSESDTDSSEESLLTAMAATTLSESPWAAAPAYPAMYLSTSSEYIPPPPKAPKISAAAQVADVDGPAGAELYENSLDVDEVFERFIKRVGYEGAQCVRYELKGTPLPFASDKLFQELFPLPPAPPLPVTKPAFKVTPPAKRAYTPPVRPCPYCGAARVFECQIMPNLINVLKTEENNVRKKLTDDERRKLVESELKGGVDRNGMEWGTCMIFSCERDCCMTDDGKESKECWREEVVLIQWDD